MKVVQVVGPPLIVTLEGFEDSSVSYDQAELKLTRIEEASFRGVDKPKQMYFFADRSLIRFLIG
jgi:hypothetical protein